MTRIKMLKNCFYSERYIKYKKGETYILEYTNGKIEHCIGVAENLIAVDCPKAFLRYAYFDEWFKLLSYEEKHEYIWNMDNKEIAY